MIFKISAQAEVVVYSDRNATYTKELTQQSGSLTCLVSDLGQVHQKVHLYGTFASGLRHSPSQMKNQHGLNEGKPFSQSSACGVTCVVSLDTNNQV